jgi:DNA-binding transcriptional regulator GbsR (MarR family)
MQKVNEILKIKPAIQLEQSVATAAIFPIRPKLKETRWFCDNEYITDQYLARLPKWVSAVYFVLLLHARGYNKNGIPGPKTQTCFPSYETIIKEGGVSRNKISPAIKILEVYNIIAVQHSRGGKKKSNQYALLSTTVWKPFNNTYLNTVLKGNKKPLTVSDLHIKPYPNEHLNRTPVDTGNHITKSTNEINTEDIKTNKREQVRKQLEEQGILRSSY